MRITQKDLYAVFEMFRRSSNIQGLRLDYYNPGGNPNAWLVVQLRDGGEREIFGTRRRTTREMYECLSFAVDLINFQENN